MWYRFLALVLLFVCFAAVVPAQGADEVGSVVALRGKVTIQRSGGSVDAKVKSGIMLHDTVVTGPGSKVKMLFVDDSVLTLSENSRLDISQFVHQKGKTGSSVYNLLDGKMRSVVGKTKFEVRTPTAVAAARGTIIAFEVGIVDGRKFTTIICLEGTVELSGVGSQASQQTVLTPGMKVTIFQAEPLPQPRPASRDEIERSRKDSVKIEGEVAVVKVEDVLKLSDPNVSAVPVAQSSNTAGGGDITIVTPPIQQVPFHPSKVRIDIKF